MVSRVRVLFTLTSKKIRGRHFGHLHIVHRCWDSYESVPGVGICIGALCWILL